MVDSVRSEKRSRSIALSMCLPPTGRTTHRHAAKAAEPATTLARVCERTARAFSCSFREPAALASHIRPHLPGAVAAATAATVRRLEPAASRRPSAWSGASTRVTVPNTMPTRGVRGACNEVAREARVEATSAANCTRHLAVKVMQLESEHLHTADKSSSGSIAADMGSLHKDATQDRAEQMYAMNINTAGGSSGDALPTGHHSASALAPA